MSGQHLTAQVIRACVVGLTHGSADVDQTNHYLSILSKLADELDRGDESFRHPGAPTELEMHRADYEAIRAAGFTDPGELLAEYKLLKAYQDLVQKEKP